MAALAAAVALRWLLDPLLGDTLPLVTVFGAVAIAVWVGGWRHALLVAVAGYVAVALCSRWQRRSPAALAGLFFGSSDDTLPGL